METIFINKKCIVGIYKNNGPIAAQIRTVDFLTTEPIGFD
jgi:hypothetical protein